MKPWLRHVLIIICLLFAVINGVHLFKGGILFHEDIARDFIIMDELVAEKKLTLIGPKTELLPGFFHGPIWYYLNLPIFALSAGDPFVMGIFWYVLYIFGVLSLGYFVKKFTDDSTALVAMTIFMGIMGLMNVRLWQESISLFLSLPFLYFISMYIYTKKITFLIIALILLGLTIHSQVAFGGPILLLTLPMLIFVWIKHKRWSHFFSLFILLLTLATYLIFEFRHDFIQTHSLLDFITRTKVNEVSYRNILVERFLAIAENFKLIQVNFYSRLWGQLPTKNEWILEHASAVMGVLSLILIHIKNKTFPRILQIAWRITLLYLIGYWVITFPFKSEIRWYYTEQLISIICLWWAYVITKYPSKIIYAVFLGTVLVNLTYLARTITTHMLNPLVYGGDWMTHWEWYKTVGEDILADSKGREFGYFAYSDRTYSYQFKYLMIYLEKKGHAKICDYCKQPLTYLVIEPKNPYVDLGIDQRYWQESKVRIDRPPNGEWHYTNTGVYKFPVSILRYELDDVEILVESDPLLDPRAQER